MGFQVLGRYNGFFDLMSGASSTVWNQTYGGELDDEAAAIVQTGDGGYAIAGTTHSFGVNPPNFWLIRTDSLGNVQWNRTYDGLGYDYAHSMVQTSDGGYALVGYFTNNDENNDLLFVKTDSLGNIVESYIWRAQMG